MDEADISSVMLNHNIEISHMSFSYDNKKVLDNITCLIKENEMTAIVGPSGSGKTTLCNMIARFWDVDEGQILIGDENIKNYTISNLMSNISMVFQNVYLFEDTIENNIKFGQPNASLEDELLCQKHKIIKKLVSRLWHRSLLYQLFCRVHRLGVGNHRVGRSRINGRRRFLVCASHRRETNDGKHRH